MPTTKKKSIKRPKGIKREELTNLRMSAGNAKKFTKVICDGFVQQWVGIGWVKERKATKRDLETIPSALS